MDKRPGPPKGTPKVPGSGGSRKGCPNKNTKALKDMILGALEGAGGEEYLQRQADNNPSAFLQLIGKVLPTTIQGGDGTKDGEPIVIHLHAGPKDKSSA